MVNTAVVTRVQFRADETELAYLRAKGLNPNDLARDAFRAEVRRMQAEDRHARLRSMWVQMPRPSEEMLREDREGRERWRPAGP